jgi:exosortase/archaeosortase family protein
LATRAIPRYRSSVSLAVEGLRTRLGARFALKYALIAGVLFAIYAFPFDLFGARSDWLSGYLAAYARLAGGVLSLFENGVVVSGARIDGRFPMEIVRNCDAIEINILFVSAVLAFPAPWRKRLSALAVGLTALVALNVLRICLLYFIGVYAPARFAVAHEQVFPLLLVVAAALAFLLCANYLRKGSLEAA